MSKKAHPVTTFISLGDIRAAGIRTISALLKGNGWESNIVIYKAGYSKEDIPTKKEEDTLFGLLRDLNTDIVGLSVKTPFLKTAKAITKRVKDELGALVVWGGIHPTIMPEESVRIADMICVGEGEFPFLELLEKVSGGKPFDRIQNFWTRRNGMVKRNGLRPLLLSKDLDELPFPDCGGEYKYIINLGKLIQGDPLEKAIEYYPMASRGCPFRCSYCINAVLKEVYRGCGPFVRLRSPENVVDEIVDVLERFPSIRRIRFQDEVFPSKIDWIARFSDAYRSRVNLPFLCTFHPQTIKEEAVKMLKKAGLIVVGFGLQSPSERIRRKVFNRPETNETVLRSMEILHRNKLEGFYDLILDNPFETEDDKREGLEFLLKIPKPYSLAAFALKFFPGYKITEKALNRGLVSASEVSTIASQNYFEMTYDWYAPRMKEDRFWNTFYLLASRSTFPRFLVRFMSRGEFFRKHPHLIMNIAKYGKYLELIVIGLRRLLRGQLKPINFLKVTKARILRQTI